jgi:hypothetical protein
MQVGGGRGDAARLENGIEDAQQIQVEIIETHGSIDLVHVCDGIAAAPACILHPSPMAGVHWNYIDFSFDAQDAGK